MTELALLGVLQDGPVHGYELKKRMRDVLGPRSSVSFGSLYPALRRLEREGAVEVIDADEPGAAATPAIPMTGSFTGEAAAFRASRRRSARSPRTRKVYRCTTAGRARLAELLATPAEDDRGFSVQLAFCRWSDPTTRLGLLERRKTALDERLDESRRAMRSRGERLDRYVRSLLEHDTESTERDIAWLDRLIHTERQTTTDTTNGGIR